MIYDIFISYKRKSGQTASNLYYRLTTRGYSTFYDLDEMRTGNFNEQLLSYIDNAKDVFVIIEDGSLDGCKREDWENDWFLFEIAHAIEKKKNIIPILLDCNMPHQEFFPDKLKELSLKQSPEFSLSFFEEYLNKLERQGCIQSQPLAKNKMTSVFKFYSNESCQVLQDGKLVCDLEGKSEEPFYLPVERKGDYRFTVINSYTGDSKTLTKHIDADEEKIVEIEWQESHPFKPNQEWPSQNPIEGENYTVDLGLLKFNMVRVQGGEMMIGATEEQGEDAEPNELPAHLVSLPTYYIGQFPITQNIWELVMGYNKSGFKYKEEIARKQNEEKLKTIDSDANQTTENNQLNDSRKRSKSWMWNTGMSSVIGGLLGTLGGPIGGGIVAAGLLGARAAMSGFGSTDFLDEYGHYPIENITLEEAREFVRRLSDITNLKFSLPSEDEWEFAARGGIKSKRYKYAGSNDIDEVAWYRENSEHSTHPVGEKKPNELGLYDMSGNVWEWTETPAHSFAMRPNHSVLLDDSTVFIRRGGSYWHKAKNCRVSKRYSSYLLKKTNGLGLRVVIRENIK